MGLERGPTNDDEGFLVSVDFKCFFLGLGPTNDNEGFFVSTDFKCFRKGVWGRKGAH